MKSGMGRIFFLISLALTLSAWFVLLYWYGLASQYNSVHFAFDKVPGHFKSMQMQVTAGILLCLPLLYMFQYWYISKQKHIRPRILWLCAVVMYLAATTALFLYPIGALDVYYYAASLKSFFFYGVNPYTTAFTSFPQDSFYPYTIAPFQLFPYGPVFLLFSGFPTFITGFENVQITILGLKFLNLLLLAGTAILIYRYHHAKKTKLLALFFFLANPLVLFEALSNVHNDLILTFFLLCGIIALQRKSIISGSFLTLAFLTKIFVLAVAPLFIDQMRQQLGVKKTLISIAGALLLCVVAIVPFWDNGTMLTGTLIGMSSTHTFYNISLYSLIKDLARFYPDFRPYLGYIQPVFIAGFIGISLRIVLLVRQGHSFISGVLQTYLWFLLLITIFYQWYLLPVLALIALHPTRKNVLLGFIITTFGLFDYMLSVAFWFDLRLDASINHFIRSLFLTFPILYYLLSELRLRASKSK